MQRGAETREDTVSQSKPGGLPAGGVLECQAPACYPGPGRHSGSTGTKEEASTGWQSGWWGCVNVAGPPSLLAICIRLEGARLMGSWSSLAKVWRSWGKSLSLSQCPSPWKLPSIPESRVGEDRQHVVQKLASPCIPSDL